MSDSKSATGNRWDNNPAQALARFLPELTFPPVKATLWFQGNYYPVAKLLGLTVPVQGEQGTLEVVPGYTMAYTWGSIDGRATDYLTLKGDFDAVALQTLVERIQTAMPIEHASDLQIFVESATIVEQS